MPESKQPHENLENILVGILSLNNDHSHPGTSQGKRQLDTKRPYPDIWVNNVSDKDDTNREEENNDTTAKPTTTAAATKTAAATAKAECGGQDKVIEKTEDDDHKAVIDAGKDDEDVVVVDPRDDVQGPRQWGVWGDDDLDVKHIDTEDCLPGELAQVDEEITQKIALWLNSIQSHGFSPSVLQKYMANEISDEDDDVWWETGLVRVFQPYYDLDQDDIKEVARGSTNKDGDPIGKIFEKYVLHVHCDYIIIRWTLE